MRRSEQRKLPTPSTALESSSSVGRGAAMRLLQDIESISKALSIKPKPTPKSLRSPSTRPRSLSNGKQPPTQEPTKSSSTSTSSSIFSWKALKSLSHIRHRRFDCQFTLHVHSIENLPLSFDDCCVFVHWKRVGSGGGIGGGGVGGRTRAAKISHGGAKFGDEMAHRCSVYGSRQNNSAKYESRQFVIWASVVAAPELDLGKHKVDLTRLLPVRLEELDGDNGDGLWSTTFRLAGRGKGGVLNVSFGYSVVRDEKVGRGKEEEDRQGGLRKAGNPPEQTSALLESRRCLSVEDVDVFREVLSLMPAENTGGVDSRRELVINERFEEVQKDASFGGGLKPELGYVAIPEDLTEHKDSMTQESSIDSRVSMVQEHANAMEEKECGDMQQILNRSEEDFDEIGFTVIEQGVEMLVEMENMVTQTSVEVENMELDESGKVEKVNSSEVGNNHIPSDKEVLGTADGNPSKVENVNCDAVGDGHVPSGKEILGTADGIPSENKLLVTDPLVEELDVVLQDLSLGNSADLDSPDFEVKTHEPLTYSEIKTNYKMGRMSKSLDLDELMESVASEFLNILGIEHRSFESTSGTEPESPREGPIAEFNDALSNKVTGSPNQIWRQFEQELNGDSNDILESNLANVDEIDWGDDIDLNKLVHAAEIEHQKETQALKSKTRAKLLEDVEAEILMREWGLDEKVFHRSLPGSRSGFGSPIDLPPEDPLDLPPLGHGLGPFLRTKDGGFLRSMNPLLFKNSKNNGSLIMQVSAPVVMPAEMGSGVMDILQRLASIGIEKLSMQASKLMPLEDIAGKNMQQVAWEALLAPDANKSRDATINLKSQMEYEHDENSFGGRKKSNTNPSSSRYRESSSKYVSLEDLAPLAVDKMEALSLEGLRIQSGISEDDAPSYIIPPFGDISGIEGRTAMNGNSLGLDGVAALQVADVKGCANDVDGLMSLSLTLDEWMKLDSGIVDEDDLNSERTSKILAAHHASSTNFISGGWKGDSREVKNSGRCGLLGNNFTVALMVQLRDPLRNYEPVGTPMLSLIQVERAFVPSKTKIYSTVYDGGNSEEDSKDEDKSGQKVTSEIKEEKEIIPQPQFKITKVHVAGLKTEPGEKKPWGNQKQQKSGSRWLLANGMGKGNKHPFLKSKPANKASQSSKTTLAGDALWSISSHIHGTGEKWGDFTPLNPHIRNPNVVLPNRL